jgi:chromosome segregation ATPase
VKVRGLIEDMIAKLEKQAQEEATEKAFCDEELSESKAKRDDLQADVDKFTARLDKASASVKALTNEVAALQKELSELASSLAEATKLRSEEKAANEAAISDFSASVEAVRNAIVTLKEYYGGASFIQQPSFASANTDTASVILSMLDVAESDFAKLLSDTKLSEEEAQMTHDKLKQEGAVSKATMEAEVKGKTSEIASLNNSISDLKSDIGSKNTQLDAVMDYLSKITKRCTSTAMTYEQRKAKRDSEITGLKEALDILAGDEAAVFIQKKAFLARK